MECNKAKDTEFFDQKFTAKTDIDLDNLNLGAKSLVSFNCCHIVLVPLVIFFKYIRGNQGKIFKRNIGDDKNKRRLLQFVDKNFEKDTRSYRDDYQSLERNVFKVYRTNLAKINIGKIYLFHSHHLAICFLQGHWTWCCISNSRKGK